MKRLQLTAVPESQRRHSLEMAKFEEVKALADATYDKIWNDWYREMLGVTKANHDLRIDDHSAGYSHSRNSLFNPICKKNLDDWDILDGDGWPIWKIQLIHEMLHEYQHKAISKASEQGRELYIQFRNEFGDDEHDDKFFTAIAGKALYFKITPEELIRKI